MKHLKIFLALVALLTLFVSCGTTKINRQLHLSQMIELTSVVQIISNYEIEHCVGDSCQTFKYSSTSTGSVIKRSQNGSYVLTTGHSCDPRFGVPFGLKNIYVKQTTLVVDSRLQTHKSTTVEFDPELDTCILHTKTLKAPVVKINTKNAPVVGDKVYNYAASYGVFGKRTIPVLEGRYSGTMWGFSLYTVPAIGGSSGSPVFNSDGELIGMIHSVHRKFHHLSFGPKHPRLMEFIDDNTPTVAPLGIRTEWTDIPGRKHKKIYLDEQALREYMKKVKQCVCKGKECFDAKKCPM